MKSIFQNRRSGYTRENAGTNTFGTTARKPCGLNRAADIDNFNVSIHFCLTGFAETGGALWAV
jgi:hypothetical protein